MNTRRFQQTLAALAFMALWAPGVSAPSATQKHPDVLAAKVQARAL